MKLIPIRKLIKTLEAIQATSSVDIYVKSIDTRGHINIVQLPECLGVCGKTPKKHV